MPINRGKIKKGEHIMKKIAMMLMCMGMASVFAGASTQTADSACANPKFSPGNMCDTLSTLTDSSRLFVAIILPPPAPDSENTPAFKAKVKVWSESLFTKYDLRRYEDTLTRLPVPPDSELSWGYPSILMTKATALALVNESFIHRLEVRTSPPSTLIYSGKTESAERENKPLEARFDVLGRGIMRTNRSMNSFVKPLKR
jgi:hypothetical protein